MSDPIQDYMNQQRTYVAFVLDKSGSMAMARRETVSGLNEHIQTVRSDATPGTLVSFTTFSNGVNIEYYNREVNELQELTEDQYVPGGSTAMYDAVGTMIDRLEQEPDINDANTAVLMIIVSDGQENASKQYKASDIASRVKRLQDTGRWTFTYIGANQDLSVITDQLGFSKGNIGTFCANSAQGYADAMTRTSVSTATYFGARSMGNTQVDTFYVDAQSDQ